jgi:hypothetical protein
MAFIDEKARLEGTELAVVLNKQMARSASG